MTVGNLIILTIGHSTHSIERFVELLRAHEITAVADVRSAPYSRFNPQYNKDALERSLKTEGIRYVFLGRELGARSDDPTCYEHGRVQYAQLAKATLFKTGLDRVIQGARYYRLALMCAEKEPLDCHRTLLVARALAERGVEVAHILADCSLEPHEAALARLLGVVGLPSQDLFRTREQLIEEALVRQEERIAFVDEGLMKDSSGEEQ
jgi:uncharacterized protein (DUF488 family)